VTRHAASAAEEQHGASLLRCRQRVLHAAGITIDRGVGEHERELELGDRAREVVERDRFGGLDFRKYP
jgi:hypothetical protein